ncbi:unnamed protein product, partial [Symbiodinium necroappetens]
EIAHVFRWHRAFAKLKTPTKEVDALSRYTNFTLGHVWEKFDCQTTLLTKEARCDVLGPEVRETEF